VVRSTAECIAKPTSRSGDEREVAEIRLAVATRADIARSVLLPIGKSVTNGSMSPRNRMSLGYAEAVA
jgi:hypothetical protein